MYKLRFLLFLLLNSSILTAQFQDNFNDGDFTNNPTWLGTTTDFIVNANAELQLNAPTGGTAQLYSPVPTADSTVWEFYFKMAFEPSNSNRLKIYLNANNSDFSASLNGYFIQIGESGSNDAIELRRQDNASSTLLISGIDGAVAIDSAEARVRVVRDNIGQWELWVDYSNGTNYTLEGTAIDNTYPQGDFFGFDCKFTSTRKDKFFFDDVLVSPLFVDNTAPTIQAVQPLSDTEIEVVFNENVELNSAQNPNNYMVNNGIGTATLATRNAVDFNIVQLTFNTPFISNQTNTLTIANVQDVVGNAILNQMADFTFINIEQAIPLDIVIHEIMADPTPSVGLPDAEFIELYNHSNKFIQLEGFKIVSGAVPQVFPNYLLAPNTFVIVCDDSKIMDFNAFGDVIGLSSFPALTNTGDEIILLDDNDMVIHEVNYDIAWYQDDLKDDGGYTLEMINPNLTCKGGENWNASIATNGGTPGQENSIFDPITDTQTPVLQNLIQLDSDTLLLVFDDILDLNISQNTQNYSLNHGIGNSATAILQADLKSVKISFSTPLSNATTYTLSISLIADCVGNATTITQDFTFFEISSAEQYDILINEIYTDFTPTLGLPETEYIELYNRSNKVTNLKNIELSVDGNAVLLPDYIFQPDAYVVIYESDININFSNFNIPTLPISNLPNLGNTAENITLSDLDNGIVHHIDYTNEWYNNSDKAEGGWSLELINPNQICESSSNWSVSTSLIGGTPGQVNSIVETDLDTQTPIVLSAFPITETMIQVTFSEALKPSTLSNTAFSIDNGSTIQSVLLEEPSFNRVLITLDMPLNNGTIYTITATNQVQDCNGNQMGLTNTTKVALPEILAEKDLIINEILFNPFTGGVDFIEIYNRSSKVLNLADLILANSDGGLIDAIEPVENNRLIFPEEYIVFTKSPTILQAQYTVSNPNQLIKNDLPSFPDKEGGVVLLSNGIIIDRKIYDEDEHYILIDDNDGVSLERLNPDGVSADKSNWHSAAATVGFATPTYQNSQFFTTNTTTATTFELAKTTFSPDGDGFEDVLLINYNLNEVGYTASIEVYDANGFLIQTIANNELLGLEGSYKWDGTTTERTKARIGIYVILVKLFSPNGQREQFKLTGVLAGQF